MNVLSSCPICTSSDLVLKRDFHRKHCGNDENTYYYQLYQCNNCKNQHWSPLEHPGKEYYENENDSIYSVMHKGRTEIKEERHLKFLSDYKNLTPSRILDVGCSDGLILNKLKEMGHEVWGIDIDSISTKIAKQRGLENVFCQQWSDFFEFALEKNLKFDLITMFDVLEHTTNPVNFLKQLKLLLSDTGTIVITVPNRERYLRDFIKTDFPPHHFFRFNQRSLLKLIEISDFKLKKIQIFQYGYSSKIITNILSKFLIQKKITPKKSVLANLNLTHEMTKKSSKSSFVKSNIIKLLQNLLWLFTFPIEILFNKGYKIYAVFSRHKNSVIS